VATDYTVFGAGSVGTVLAALLADAGIPVAIAGRDATGDLRVEGEEESLRVGVPVVEQPEGTILLCVREPDVAGLCERWPGREVVTFQNGVESESRAARHCRVIGGVWRMTCTLIDPGHARFTRRGRVVVGRHPAGVDEGVERLAAALRAARLDVGVSRDIRSDKWLKLFANLTSGANAVIRKAHHATPPFAAVKRLLLEEALEAFAWAGIVARSCDGRDLEPERELERQVRMPPRKSPVYNATWRQLSRGRRPCERYHATLAELGRRHGFAARRNEAMQLLIDEAPGPECYGAAEVLARLEAQRR